MIERKGKFTLKETKQPYFVIECRPKLPKKGKLQTIWERIKR